MAKLNLVGDGIDGYGCPPMSPIATGLVHMELNRGDGSLGTFLGMRHMADIEAIHTCEGAETVKTLIVGRDITGASAFA